MGDFITIEIAIVGFHRFTATDYICGRYTDSYRMLILVDAPFQHGEIFLLTGRCQIDHIGDIADKWNIEETEVSYIIHTG